MVSRPPSVPTLAVSIPSRSAASCESVIRLSSDPGTSSTNAGSSAAGAPVSWEQPAIERITPKPVARSRVLAGVMSARSNDLWVRALLARDRDRLTFRARSGLQEEGRHDEQVDQRRRDEA